MKPASENRPIRMVASRGPAGRDWSAWLENEPQQACGGMSALNSVRRWLSLNRNRFPGPYAIEVDEQSSHLDRLIVRLTTPATCGECGGSGKYIGLHVVENCSACDGNGLVAVKSPTD